MKQLIAALAICLTFACYGRTVYCSSSSGSDSNPGTALRPFATIAKGLSVADTVLLKRGDVFYERVNAASHHVGAYSIGSKPVISGLKIPNGRVKWQRGKIVGGIWKKSSTGNVWKLDLSKDNSYYDGFRTNGSNVFNNIGSVVLLDDVEKIYSRHCQYITELNEDFDFYQACENPAKAVASDFDFIYLYSKTNPNKLKIGLSVGTNGIDVRNGSVSDLNIEFWGRHGITVGSNSHIDGCTVDHIGGIIERGYPVWCILGNGIEIWCADGAQNIEVANCRISHCYDAGLTLQGIYKTDDVVVKDISFHNNVVYNCAQGWEDFYRNEAQESPLKFINCYVSDNKFVDNGFNTGFRELTPRFKHCQVLANSSAPTDMVLSGNIFADGNFRACSKLKSTGLYNPQIFIDNVVYIVRGQSLFGNYGGTADVVYVPVEAAPGMTLEQTTQEAINKYRSLTGDKNTRFVVCDSPDDPRIVAIRQSLFN